MGLISHVSFQNVCFQMAQHTRFSIPMSRQLATSEINKMESKKKNEDIQASLSRQTGNAVQWKLFSL